MPSAIRPDPAIAHRRPRRWLGVLAAALGLALAAWAALLWLLPPDRALADRLVAEAAQRLGVPVHIGALRWQLLPRPMVVLENARTGQAQPVTVQTLRVYPALLPLLQRQLVLRRIEIDGAVAPQLSLRELGPRDAPAGTASGSLLPRQLQFRQLTWITRTGVALPLEGHIAFDPDGRPGQVDIRRPDFQPLLRLQLQRQSARSDTVDRWLVRLALGGGSADGEARLRSDAAGRLLLEGELAPRGVEVQGMLAAVGRRAPLRGRADGQTTLSAQADTLVGLGQTLHTRTRFTMEHATLEGFDLDKALRSGGREHAGQTALSTVSGVVDTQNTPQGIVATYTGLKAHAGGLVASGQATLAHRQINAEFAVDLVDGVVGLPLRISGPYASPRVSVPPGALAGAVVGTAVLPGVGTAVGARIGATVGKLFSPGAEPVPVRPAGRASAPR